MADFHPEMYLPNYRFTRIARENYSLFCYHILMVCHVHLSEAHHQHNMVLIFEIL